MILESKQPCDGCAYMQATGYDADSATVCLEAQHIHATPGKTQYQNCGKQIAFDTLLDICNRFAARQVPDTTGREITFTSSENQPNGTIPVSMQKAGLNACFLCILVIVMPLSLL